MKSLRLVLGFAAVLGALALLLVYHLEFGDVFRGVRRMGSVLFSSRFSYESVEALQAENARLRAAVALLEGADSAPTSFEEPLRRARLYSRYPFNDRERLMIGLGTREGVREGMAVFAYESVLLGTVVKAGRMRAEVQTVFDPGFKSSVVVGQSRTKAVLVGGTPPRLTLIPQDASLAPGDSVLSISPEFPMGMLWGIVESVDREQSDTWQTARLSVPYRAETLEWILLGDEIAFDEES
ncbi:MAG: rod shape-determining protein MreC [Patescibacteria group bacterium]